MHSITIMDSSTSTVRIDLVSSAGLGRGVDKGAHGSTGHVSPMAKK